MVLYVFQLTSHGSVVRTDGRKGAGQIISEGLLEVHKHPSLSCQVWASDWSTCRPLSAWHSTLRSGVPLPRAWRCVGPGLAPSSWPPSQNCCCRSLAGAAPCWSWEVSSWTWWCAALSSGHWKVQLEGNRIQRRGKVGVPWKTRWREKHCWRTLPTEVQQKTSQAGSRLRLRSDWTSCPVGMEVGMRAPYPSALWHRNSWSGSATASPTCHPPAMDLSTLTWPALPSQMEPCIIWTDWWPLRRPRHAACLARVRAQGQFWVLCGPPFAKTSSTRHHCRTFPCSGHTTISTSPASPPFQMWVTLMLKLVHWWVYRWVGGSGEGDELAGDIIISISHSQASLPIIWMFMLLFFFLSFFLSPIDKWGNGGLVGSGSRM